MRRRKTKNIISLFLLILLLFFLSITLIAYKINKKKKDIFIQSNQTQIEKSVKLAYSFESNRLHQVLFDNSFWDEMVNFVEKGNNRWANINIDPMVSTFSVDAIWVFDTSENKKYCKTQDKCPELNSFIFDSFVFGSLWQKKFIKFYSETPIGVIEVFGATIHPSLDPQRKTKPRGFLLIGRYINNNYLSSLSTITATQVSLINDTLQDIDSKGRHTVSFNIPLKTLDNKVVKYLRVKKSLDYLEQFETVSVILIFLNYISALVIFIAFIFIIFIWVNKPLIIVERALETDDIQIAKSLNRYGREFTKIGRLISLYISQKRSLEILKNRAEESDRLKSAFMANMSHEIRTPLNGIMGFSELLCKTHPSEEAADSYRKIIQKCSNNLMRLVGDILDYSRIEAGQLIISDEVFSTETLIDELYNHYESKQKNLSQKGIDLIFSRSGGIFDINSDKPRLKQILSSLISNSIKFTEKGIIEVTFTKKGDRVIFQVMDTGIGISEELQQIIFERFWQAAQPKSKLYGGTGLGLALSKGLVSLLGGNISVESQVGVGSTFFIDIPIQPKERIRE